MYLYHLHEYGAVCSAYASETQRQYMYLYYLCYGAVCSAYASETQRNHAAGRAKAKQRGRILRALGKDPSCMWSLQVVEFGQPASYIACLLLPPATQQQHMYVLTLLAGRCSDCALLLPGCHACNSNQPGPTSDVPVDVYQPKQEHAFQCIQSPAHSKDVVATTLTR